MVTGSVLRKAAVGGATAVVLLGGGSAVAAAAGSATTAASVYQGCLGPSGQLHQVEVDAAAAPNCPSREQLITWNQSGPTGPQGPKGDTGETGPQGPTGDKGDSGTPGESAYQIWLDQGNTGTETDFLASLKGTKGDTGATGPAGPAGPAAPTYTQVPLVHTWSRSVNGLTVGEVDVACPLNGGRQEYASGGGAGGDFQNFNILESRPILDNGFLPIGWHVRGYNTTLTSDYLVAYAICQ
jgi:hypothetical protein